MRKTNKMLEVEGRIGEPIEEFLRREYHDNLKSSAEIGKLLKISQGTALQWLKHFAIARRPLSASQSVSWKKRKKKPSAKELIKLRNDGKSQSEIAKIYGVKQSAVSKWLISYGIRSVEYKKKGVPPHTKRPSKSYLEKLYNRDKKSTYEIANILGVTQTSVSNWLKEYRIQIRDPTTALLLSFGKDIEVPTPEKLKGLYVSQKMSLEKIGKLLWVNTGTVRNWLANAGIPIRTHEQASQIRYFGKELDIPDRDTLSKLYLEDNLSASKIAELVGVSENLILIRLRKAGIKRRGQREAAFIRYGKDVQVPSKRELEGLYVEERKSSSEIGEIFGVDPSTVLCWLAEEDTPIRDVSGAQLARFGKILKKPSKRKLKKWYVDEMMTTHDIADMVGVSHATVRQWLKKDGIELREAVFSYNEWLNCMDGHRVRSGYERRVDNWLYLNGILHRYDVELPGLRKFKCDFKVNDVFVEVWGLTGIKHYDKKTREKILYYKKHKLSRINIFPEDFNSNNSFIRKLEPLLNYSDSRLRKQRQLEEFKSR